ncbi:DUF5330 domain-containing protein [Hansschlegelia quercus]|uniref:DUF5330 domain-containing protein n=1 Tax=Hansschlegelia quercus TaxID=2528245 RepID=A0A4Q9GAN0_9HYPH|nr:DUF5330 domain-containing protein [Hansschlegelia quercus]TBN47948.1 hypothetical protein EYR15_15125 [Hansschlegelia quercus]
MFFLLRTAFWISLLLLFLPLGGVSKDGPNADERASLDALSALAAAGATVSDVGSFCQRQPDACTVGSQALKIVGERASVGASMLQDYFGSDAKPSEVRAKPVSATAAPAGRDTLNPTDRKPAWRGAARTQA